MSARKIRKVESSEITVAKINAKQAIVIAAVGLIAAIAVPILTNRLRSKEEPLNSAAAKEEIGFYKGRYSTISETLRDNLKTAKKVTQLLSSYDQCKKAECTNEVKRARGIAERISARIEKASEQLDLLNQQHLAALDKGARLEASETRLKANALINEIEAQTVTDQRELAIAFNNARELTSNANLNGRRYSSPARNLGRGQVTVTYDGPESAEVLMDLLLDGPEPEPSQFRRFTPDRPRLRRTISLA